MTTSTYAEQRATTSWPMYAALGAGVALVLAAIGTFWDVSGNDTKGGSLGEYLSVAAIILVTTALVFGLVVRTATPASAATRALVLSIVGLVTIIAFWSGLPPVLAFAAIACALGARPAGGDISGTGKAALGIAGVTLVLAVVAAIVG